VWIIIAWWLISPEVIVKGFMKCYISSTMDETVVDVLWNGDVRSVRKMKALTVKMETSLIGKGR
jgi:hypothetical protein